MLSSVSDEVNLFAENFFKNSYLDDSGIALPVFIFHHFSVSPKMVKKVISNIDLSKVFGPDCIPVVVLSAELFNKCLKESCFPDCWNVSLTVPVFKNVEERSTAINCHPLSLLSVVSKFFEKLVNNGIIDHLEECGCDCGM